MLTGGGMFGGRCGGRMAPRGRAGGPPNGRGKCGPAPSIPGRTLPCMPGGGPWNPGGGSRGGGRTGEPIVSP